MSMYLPNREELSFLIVFALPNAEEEIYINIYFAIIENVHFLLHIYTWQIASDPVVMESNGNHQGVTEVIYTGVHSLKWLATAFWYRMVRD